MNLIIFNIIIGVLLIIGAICIFIQLHCRVKATEDSLMRGYLRNSYCLPVMLILFAVFKLCNLESNNYFPELDMSDAIIFLVIGIVWILMTKYVLSKKITYAYSEAFAGYIAGTAMLLIGAMDIVLIII